MFVDKYRKTRAGRVSQQFAQDLDSLQKEAKSIPPTLGNESQLIPDFFRKFESHPTESQLFILNTLCKDSNINLVDKILTNYTTGVTPIDCLGCLAEKILYLNHQETKDIWEFAKKWNIEFYFVKCHVEVNSKWPLEVWLWIETQIKSGKKFHSLFRNGSPLPLPLATGTPRQMTQKESRAYAQAIYSIYNNVFDDTTNTHYVMANTYSYTRTSHVQDFIIGMLAEVQNHRVWDKAKAGQEQLDDLKFYGDEIRIVLPTSSHERMVLLARLKSLTEDEKCDILLKIKSLEDTMDKFSLKKILEYPPFLAAFLPTFNPPSSCKM
jgi:hypothetical protein